MRRKIRAAFRILFCHGYILCTIKKGKENTPFYDHNICEEDVLRYNAFILSVYAGNQSALRQAKEMLDID